MTAKRFELIIDSEWWIVKDNSIKSNKYRNDLDGDDAYRGLKEGELTEEETVELLNELAEENQRLKKQLESEHTMLDNAILLERTRMGQNSLKQYKEAIQ